MKENNFIKVILLLIFSVITIGLSLIYIEQHTSNAIQKSKFSEELKVYYENHRIDSAIENDIYSKKPLLINNKGRWEEKDIDNYLGFFEILSDYIDAGSLNVRDVNDEYSDVILTAYNTKEIKEYIAKVRRETNDKEFYIKFETLAKRFSR